MQSKPLIAVWFSCGAASAVAAKLTIEKYSETHDVRVVNSPVIEEDIDNRRFLFDVQRWLGVKIEFAINPEYNNCSIIDVFKKRKYVSGIAGAPCTKELKKVPRQIWEAKNKPDFHVLGFTVDEKHRYDRFIKTERDNVIPVLIDANMSKQDCVYYLQVAGIELPRIYKYGFPNANCVGCVKATSATYWNLVRSYDIEKFNTLAKVSRDIGCRLARDGSKRVFLDELSPDAKGRDIKSLDFECGIFCEEKHAPQK